MDKSNNYAVIIEPMNEPHLLDAVCIFIKILGFDFYSFDENIVRERELKYIFYFL